MIAEHYEPDVAAKRTELEGRGYREIEGIGGLRPGVRVCNRGERYADAIRHGTAEVVAVYEKVPSPWSHSYGRRDVEVIVARVPLIDGLPPVGLWADYGCAIALTESGAAS